MSLNFISILWNGITPLPFYGVVFATAAEIMIADVLTLFRILTYIIIGLDIYFVLKNRKVDS